MANDKPPFDPNKPFEAVGTTGAKPPFDPNKPFQPVEGSLATGAPGRLPESQQTLGAGESTIFGIADLLKGSQSIATHIAGSPEQQQAFDQAMRQRNLEFTQRGGSPGFRALGQATAGIPFAAAGPMGVGAAAAGGALSGMLGQPEVPVRTDIITGEKKIASDEYWQRQAVNAGMGGFTGALGGVTGRVAGGLADPTMTNAAKFLSNKGVRLTPAMMREGGGWLGQIEEKMAKAPILGAALRDAQRQGVQGWRRAVYNQVLEPLGQKLNTKTSVVKLDAINEARNKIDTYTNRIIVNTPFTFNPQFGATVGTFRTRLPQSDRAEYAKIVNQHLGPMFSQGMGQINPGKDFQIAYNGIGKEIEKAKSPELKNILNDLRESMRTELKVQNPQYIDQLKNVDFAEDMFRHAKDATTIRPDFLPTDVLRVTDPSTGPVSAGRTLVREFGEAGQKVLPELTTPSYAAGLTEAGGLYASPHTAIPAALAANLLYSRPVQSALNLGVGSRGRQLAGSGLQRGLPAAGIGTIPFARPMYGGPQE